ncbi:MAG: hypothetical protein HY331_18725 [Chloroflexi bacterium]|nr:hypothetical protein [Chloroflexota bacterium]
MSPDLPGGQDASGARPRADIHLHLEGRARSARWHARQVGQHPFDHAALLDRLAAADLAGGIDRLNWLAEHLPAPPSDRFMAEHLAAMTADLCLDAAGQGACLIEVRFGAAEWRRRGLSATEVVRAMRLGAELARPPAPIALGTVACIVRNGDRADLERLIAEAVAAAPAGLDGIDLVQKEADTVVPLRDLVPLVDAARAAGLGITSHSGEFTGPRNVAETVEMLGIRRIGHAVRAGEDPGVVRLLRDLAVVVECCLTANVVLGVVPTLRDHPARRYADAGVAVTFNTDDPLVFATSIAHEYRLASQFLGFTSRDLRRCTRTAVSSAFVAESAKRQLLDQLQTATPRRENGSMKRQVNGKRWNSIPSAR